MPKGVYEKDYLYRKTSKLKEGAALLRAHDRDFKLQPLMTNEDVYQKLHEFGFRYADGMWYKPRSLNGHAPVETEVTVKPTSESHLEVTLSNDQLDAVQQMIEAMRTLGFSVEVHIVGKKD